MDGSDQLKGSSLGGKMNGQKKPGSQAVRPSGSGNASGDRQPSQLKLVGGGACSARPGAARAPAGDEDADAAEAAASKALAISAGHGAAAARAVTHASKAASGGKAAARFMGRWLLGCVEQC